MADIIISLADGRQLSFPEGTSTEVINKVAKQQTLQSQQTDEGFIANGEPEISYGLGFEKGITEPHNQLRQRSRNLTDGRKLPIGMASGLAGIPNMEKYRPISPEDATTQFNQKLQMNAEQGIQPSQLAEIGGNIVYSAPTMATKGYQGLMGGIDGLLMSRADTTGGLIKDATIGAGTAIAGSKLIKGLGRVLSPNSSPAGDLYNQGLKNLTPGQALGGFAKGVEDALTSIPYVGDMILNARVRGIEDFNSIVVKDVLEPLGKLIPKNIPKFGREAVQYVQKTLDDQYDALLPKLNIVNDNIFGLQLSKIPTKYNGMSRVDAQTLNSIIKNRIPPKLYTEGLTGKQYKFLETNLRELATSKAQSKQMELANAVNEIADEIDALLIRSNPKYANELIPIKKSYAKLTELEKAAGSTGAERGLFTPAQYLAAIKSSDKSVRKRQFAGGTRANQKLAEDAKEVLPSKLPDSGTAKRATAASLLGLLGSAPAASMGLINPVTAAAIFGTAGAYSRPGQRAINAGLFGRGTPLRQARDNVEKYLDLPAQKIGTMGYAQQNRDNQ